MKRDRAFFESGFVSGGGPGSNWEYDSYREVYEKRWDTNYKDWWWDGYDWKRVNWTMYWVEPLYDDRGRMVQVKELWTWCYID